MTSDTKPIHALDGKLGKVAGRSNAGKAILHTIDPDFILGIGRISEFGARKYHMRNFMMAPGMKWSDVYESLLRHLMAYWGGEELDLGPNGEFGPTDDPDTNMKWSGMPHLLHVAWNVMVMYTYSRHEAYAPGDDRPAVIEQSGGLWTDWNHAFDVARGVAQAEPVPDVDPQAELKAAIEVVNTHFAGTGNALSVTFDAALNRVVDLNLVKSPAEPAFMRDNLRQGMVDSNRSEKA